MPLPQKFAAGGFLLVVLLLLFAGAMGRDLNHDEHQFLVPGALLAREGLQPYRDYPLFHLPNLVFVYAALDRLVDRPMLMARLFSALCAFGMVAITFRSACQNAFFGHRARVAAAVGAALFLLLDPLFSFTTGRSWNHDLPALLTVLAVVLQIRAARRLSLGSAALSALCAGLAAGTRLTYAPILIPLWLILWLLPCPLRRRFHFAALYLAVATAALGPSWYYLFTCPEAFLFGNLEFPRLRLLDPENDRIRKTMAPSRKLRFFFKEVVIPSWPLFLAYLSFAVQPAYLWIRDRTRGSFGAALVLVVLPFALLGCFTPSRYQYQHFFVIIPLLVTGLVAALACEKRSRWLAGPRAAILFGALCLVTLWRGASAYEMALGMEQPARWFPLRAFQTSRAVKSQVSTYKVLTLSPSALVEAGVRVYPEFATGPFAWRSAQFAPAEKRRRLRLVAPEDLDAWLAKEPPGGILTGVEKADLERPLIGYAKAHGFRALNLEKSRTLWLPPSP